jgi:hypothetical protein
VILDVANQRAAGVRRRVRARFVLLGHRPVGFTLGRYDSSRTLVVDPVLAFSSYLGGSGNDDAENVTADPAGNAYVVGRFSSFEFPVANGFDTRCGTDAEGACNPYDSWIEGHADAYVAKLDPAGNLLWATYLGGGRHDGANDIALDSSLRPTVSGVTDSLDFPVTPGAYKTAWPAGCAQNDCWSPFVVRLAPDGRSLQWSTLFDGGLSTRIQDLAVDGSGDVALVDCVGQRRRGRAVGEAADQRAGGGECQRRPHPREGRALELSPHVETASGVDVTPSPRR